MSVNLKKVGLESPLQSQSEMIEHKKDIKMGSNHGNTYKCMICCKYFGIILSILFAIQLTFVPKLVNNMVDTSIKNAFVFGETEPNNDHYMSWITNNYKNPNPIQFYVSLYNITNPMEVLNGSYPKLFK